jgi:thiol-disulfide isomerase/thioredoxin
MCIRAAFAGLLIAGAALAQDSGESVDIDQVVKDFTLTDVVSGKPVKLSDFKGKVVVINFISYKCPVSLAYDERLAKFAADRRKSNVVVLHIDSNEPNLPEEAKKHAEEVGLGAPVLRDSGNRMADYFAARTTPHAFVIDAAGKLAYRGPFDNGRGKRWATVDKHYVADAVDALLAGKAPPVRDVSSFGCIIRRARKLSAQ